LYTKETYIMHETLTAESDGGRAAVAEIMALGGGEADLGGAPPEWVRVLAVDGTPVSFLAVDPNCRMEYPRGDVPYALLRAGATREDRRGQGHFRTLLEDTLAALRQAGIPWIVGRLPYGLGQLLGFAAFTNYSSFLLRPEEIEQTLAGGRPDGMEGRLTYAEFPDIQEDLLLVTDVDAQTEFECVQALREAAWIARSRGKARIVFEHPPAALPGSRYPIHDCRQTTLTMAAMTCFARVRITGADADEEKEEVDHAVAADMIRIVDLAEAVRLVTAASGVPSGHCPRGVVALDDAAGQATITVGPGSVEATPGLQAGAPVVPFSAAIMAQILTGYRSAKTLAYQAPSPIAGPAIEMLDCLFPRFWRFSRNEKWLSKQWAERATLQAWE
jgi:GNAT superfamily N-acetyltransferase